MKNFNPNVKNVEIIMDIILWPHRKYKDYVYREMLVQEYLKN